MDNKIIIKVLYHHLLSGLCPQRYEFLFCPERYRNWAKSLDILGRSQHPKVLLKRNNSVIAGNVPVFSVCIFNKDEIVQIW